MDRRCSNISSSEAMKKAREHLHQAMKQPSSLAHWVASNILITEGNYQAAVTQAKQIVALDSNNADGYAILAKALELTGRSDASSRLIEKAETSESDTLRHSTAAVKKRRFRRRKKVDCQRNQRQYRKLLWSFAIAYRGQKWTRGNCSITELMRVRISRLKRRAILITGTLTQRH